MTPEYHNVIAHVRRNHDKELERTQAAVMRSHTRASETIAALSKTTAEFLATGIFDTTEIENLWSINYHQVGFGHAGWRWHRYIKQVAKEAGRPYVAVSHSRYGRYIGRGQDDAAVYEPGDKHIFLTKRKYTQPLIAMFVLLDHCAVINQDTRQWQVTLRGIDGKAAYDTWRNECASNPGYLKALRIIK